jgi:hypothetical protein
MRPKFDAKFADGGFASKQIAELHQEAAQRSVEKGGEDYLDPKGRKEAYKQDAKLVSALAALERAAEEAAVVAADGEAEAGEANEGNEGVDRRGMRGMGSPLNVFVSTIINSEIRFL